MDQGRRVRLSNGRRLIDDVVRIANRTPLATCSRDFDLTILNSLRRKIRPKISWNVLMMKAYGIVCKQIPELRRAYVSMPWPHFYESNKTVCMLTMNREYKGEERLFFARFSQPEEFSLRQLQDKYDHLRKAPLDEISQFKSQIWLASAPWPVRRFVWWGLYNLWPNKRANHMGTFGMSLSGHKSSYGSHLLGPNTTTIGIDPFPRRSVSRFLFTFDHRVIDGAPAAAAIESMLTQLYRPITFEMKGLMREQGQDPDVFLNEEQARRNHLKICA